MRSSSEARGSRRNVRRLQERVESLRADLEAVERELDNLRLDPEEPPRNPRPPIGTRVRIIVGRSAFGDRYEYGTIAGYTRRRVKVAIDGKDGIIRLRALDNVKIIQDGQAR